MSAQDDQGGELEWLNDLATRVAERIRLKRTLFQAEFQREHRRKCPYDSDEVVRNLTFAAIKPHEHGFYVQAMGEIVTSDIARKAEGVYFRVSRILRSRQKHRKTDNRRKDLIPTKRTTTPQLGQTTLKLGRNLTNRSDPPIHYSPDPALLQTDGKNVNNQPPAAPNEAVQMVSSLLEEVDRECSCHNFLAYELCQKHGTRKGRVI